MSPGDRGPPTVAPSSAALGPAPPARPCTQAPRPPPTPGLQGRVSSGGGGCGGTQGNGVATLSSGREAGAGGQQVQMHALRFQGRGRRPTTRREQRGWGGTSRLKGFEGPSICCLPRAQSTRAPCPGVSWKEQVGPGGQGAARVQAPARPPPPTVSRTTPARRGPRAPQTAALRGRQGECLTPGARTRRSSSPENGPLPQETKTPGHTREAWALGHPACPGGEGPPWRPCWVPAGLPGGRPRRRTAPAGTRTREPAPRAAAAWVGGWADGVPHGRAAAGGGLGAGVSSHPPVTGGRRLAVVLLRHSRT